ncbi:MHC class I-like protein MILL1 [Megalobrama amblycephala]|uniref:MHC class I-like protein MILL1 n=1 Tax=Megalobrama amblycephala TaxID=75352 RepID=UPI00201427D2|nr:MHC class I-like protein MILL1 [Megalobrama amblycephala]XP_048059151.1 MHC class I-like protein MILL1 [Megalobrama amblycephala]
MTNRSLTTVMKKRAWVRKNLTDWTEAPEPPDSREKFLNLLHSLSKSTTGDDHVLQRTVGCKLEKHPNGTVKSLVTFDKYGFDGEDLITFNPDTMKWIVDAKETKKEWDHQIRRNKPIKYFRKTCTDWILTFNNTIKIKPDVFVRKAAADDESKIGSDVSGHWFLPQRCSDEH